MGTTAARLVAKVGMISMDSKGSPIPCEEKLKGSLEERLESPILRTYIEASVCSHQRRGKWVGLDRDKVNTISYANSTIFALVVALLWGSILLPSKSIQVLLLTAMGVWSDPFCRVEEETYFCSRSNHYREEMIPSQMLTRALHHLFWF